MWNRLKTTKTLKLAAAGILTVVGAYLSDQMDVKEMIYAIAAGLATLFLRDGVAKSGPAAPG